MDRAVALERLGLGPDAGAPEIEQAYRALRRPLLKELNKHDADAQPAELTAQLEELEAAFQRLQADEVGTPPPPTPTRVLGKAQAPEAGDAGAAAGPPPAAPHEPEARPRDAPPPKPEERPAPAGTPPSTGRAGIQPGGVLLGRYEVKERISHRPEGDTYRVHDRVRKADVALKVVDPGLMRLPGARARVKRGVLTASHVHHPRLARVLDLHEMQHTFAIAQELPPGQNLWELVHGEDAQPARFTPELVLQIAAEATLALAHLHGHMTHATLRPESVWVADDGTVKISDYGFGELRGPLRARRLSRSKLGTAYWAPEQHAEDVFLDPRSDQHALALILYEVLSGKPTVGRTVRVRTFRRDLPPRFTTALERALATKPLRRFADMNAFGQAAFPATRFKPEGAPPTEAAVGSLLVPALCLLALFAAFVVSPLGTAASDALSDAVRRWHAAEARVADADLDRRRLDALSGRLAERREALDEASRGELDRVRRALARTVPTAADRRRFQDDLAQIVRQLVATSRRRAAEGLENAASALDRVEDLGPSRVSAADAEIAEAARALESASPPDLLDAVTALVRREAGARRIARTWRTARLGPRTEADLAGALRSVLEAEAALAIGDEAATGRAYDEAATRLAAVSAAAERAAAAVEAYDPFAKPPRIATPVEAAQAKPCLDALLGAASDLTADAELARVLAGLLADAGGEARVRSSVDPAGFWTVDVAVAGHAAVLGGTWAPAGAAQRLRVTVAGRRRLEAPYEVAAARGDDRPGVGDVVAAFTAAPRDVTALWSARRGEEARLPAPAFDEPERTLRAGDLGVRGTIAGGAGDCVLVEGRRFALEDEAFEARVRVPGDVLGTWVRAHAAAGLASGPGAWMRLRTDGVAPRVHLLAPAVGTPREAGSAVAVQAVVYDSNLRTLEVGGEARTLRRDDVYVLLEQTLTAPATGTLTLPIRAVDAAGNETTVEWTWPVR